MSAPADSLIRDLGHALGLQLAWDSEGECALLFDQDLHTELRQDSEDGLLHLVADVGPLPPDGQERLLQDMALANLAPDNQGHCALALDRDTVVLGTSLPLQDLGPQAVLHALRDMVLTARQWRAAMSDASARADAL